MTARALRGRDCLATSSFTIRSDCTSRWATARLPKFTSTRPYRDKKSKKDKTFSHLKNTSFTVLTKGSTILLPDLQAVHGDRARGLNPSRTWSPRIPTTATSMYSSGLAGSPMMAD